MMRRIPRPSAAMIVAVIALIVAIGGSAVALPGKFTVGKNDLKQSSVGARSLGRMIVGYSHVVGSRDPIAFDGQFTETRGTVLCPARAPLALDPSVGNMSRTSFEASRRAIENRWGAPRGYEFVISGDEGPDFGYTMKVNCLPLR